MYLSHFDLKKQPFHITPDPAFFFLSPSHKEAIASLIYGLRNKKGFIALIGEVGLGKTTVLRSFIDQYATQSKTKTIFVFNTNISFKGLLKIIYAELDYDLPSYACKADYTEPLIHGLEEKGDPSDETSDLIQHLHTKLIEEYQEGTNVILIIDEAQNMPVQTLEQLRMLSNLETSADKLLQIFLIGQPELERTLNKKELRQLKQRIAIRAIIKSLTRQETYEYIQHRLRKAGAGNKRIFTRGALKKISTLSQGTPRKINILCDNALITGFGYGKKTISTDIIQEVNNDIEGRSHKPLRRMAIPAVMSLLLLVVIASSLIVLTPLKQGVANFVQETPMLAHGVSSFRRWTGLDVDLSPNQSNPDNAASQVGLETSPPGDGASGPAGSAQTPSTQATPSSSDSQPVKEVASHTKSTSAHGGENPNVLGQRPETSQDGEVPTLEAQKDETVHEQDKAASLAQVPESTSSSQNRVANVSKALPTIDYDGRFIKLVLQDRLSFFNDLSKVRQRVLIEMCRQTSINGLMTFERMIAAMGRGDYDEAARQMIYSRWAERMGKRAFDLSNIMRTGRQEEMLAWLREKKQ